MAIARMEMSTATVGLQYSLIPKSLSCEPWQYQTRLSKKLIALENYLWVAPCVVPEYKTTHTFVLWHGDLHSQDIFVDPKDPSRIVGVID